MKDEVLLIAPTLPNLQSPTNANLLTQRPYFLVPFGDDPGTDEDKDRKTVEADLREYIKASGPFTDVFVLCHGWHRNLCSGVAAYDRLMSRFGLLVSRGRINPKKDFGETFRPLFLAVHWNSDPSIDGWVDTAGRRDKSSFLQQVRLAFQPDPTQEAQFLTDVEDAFALMSQISASGAEECVNVNTPELQQLYQSLIKYNVRGQRQKLAPEMVICTLWRCYFEATAMSFLEPQGVPPEPIGPPEQAASTLLKFVAGFVAVGAIATAILGPFWDWLGFPTDLFEQEVLHIFKWAHSPQLPLWSPLKIGIVVGITATGWASLAIAAHTRSKQRVSTSGVPFQALLGAPTQIVAAIPILVYLLFTFLFRSPWSLGALVLACLGWYGLAVGWLVAWFLIAMVLASTGEPLSGVFREKLKAPEDRAKNLREYLVAPAYTIVTLLKASIGADSAIYRAATGIQNQFAFFKMQRRGVEIGCQVGKWVGGELASIVSTGAESNTIRLHFIGHSFGSLVTSNATRTLAQLAAGDGQSYRSNNRALFYSAAKSDPLAQITENVFKPGPLLPQPRNFSLIGNEDKEWPGNRFDLRSVVMVQGAIASDWYESETAIQSSVTGRVACVYSAYDTANGFYYPFANNGRMAAGFVGMFGVNAVKVGGGQDTALLVEPPIINQTGFVNFDASRLIFNGAAASGGGHDDVFKDDVVNLIWALVRPPNQTAPAQTRSAQSP